MKCLKISLLSLVCALALASQDPSSQYPSSTDNHTVIENNPEVISDVTNPEVISDVTPVQNSNTIPARNSNVVPAQNTTITDSADIDSVDTDFTNIVLVEQTLSKTVGKYEVTASGNIPENAELSARRIYNTDKLEEVIGDPDYSIYVAFDIEILVNGEVWQPVDFNETVSITVDNIDMPEEENLAVYRIEDEAIETLATTNENTVIAGENTIIADKNAVIELDAVINDDGTTTVETDHFTIYTYGPRGSGYNISVDSYEVNVNDGKNDTKLGTIDSKGAYLSAGSTFNSKIASLANPSRTFFDADDSITTIKWQKDNITSDTILTTSWSPIQVYATISDDKTVVTLHTNATTVYLNASSYSMFSKFHKLTSIDFSMINTSNATDMSSMFNDCSSLTNLDLSKFNTSNVTNMSHMFDGCNNLASINVSSFNTSNITNMNSMFCHCKNLAELDLSNFNTSNVTDMGNMFWECSSLTALNVSKFNTSKVTNIANMFADCSKLTSLNVSNFDTTNVTAFIFMFGGCESLTSLDLSNFNTSNATNLSGMFFGCSTLTNLNISKFNTANATDMSDMFRDCSSLTTLDVSTFNTSNVTDMGGMFRGCPSLTTLDVSAFNTSNVTEMGYMFSGCSKLTNLNLSKFNMAKVTSATSMLFGLNSVREIKTPITTGNTATTNLPTTMYLDDNNDNKPDSTTGQTQLTINNNKSHIYKRFCSINFDSNGGSDVAKQMVVYGDKATPPTAPTKEGYVFKEWKINSSWVSTAFDFNNPITSDTYLIAVWGSTEYTITYILNGGTNSFINPSKYSASSMNITLYAPTRSGYIFKGWTGSNGSTPQTTVKIASGSTGNKTYTAHWEGKKYTITLDANGGEEGSMTKTITATYGSPMPTITAFPTKRGYSFAGYRTILDAVYYKADGTSYKNWDSTLDDKLYAIWEGVPYTVKFNGNGNTGGSTASLAMKYGTSSRLPANGFTKKYTVTYDSNGGSEVAAATGTYSFTGWAKSATGDSVYNDQARVYNLTDVAGDTVNLYAIWNSGTVTLPTPTKPEYTLEGWYKDQTLTQKVGNGGDEYIPSANTTLYANWEKSIYYTVSVPASISFSTNIDIHTDGDDLGTYYASSDVTVSGFFPEGTALDITYTPDNLTSEEANASMQILGARKDADLNSLSEADWTDKATHHISAQEINNTADDKIYLRTELKKIGTYNGNLNLTFGESTV